MGFQAHVLRFELEATSEIHLRHHKGSAFRGAFLHALRTDFCTNPSLRSCHVCSIHNSCPVCFLVSTTDDDNNRGVDTPRPYVIEPPLDSREVYYPRDGLDFNVVLFSRALSLFPYVIVAVRRMGELGLGASRGRFILREVWAVEPLAGLQQRVLRRGDDLVKVPNIPVEHDQVMEMATRLPRPVVPNPHSPVADSHFPVLDRHSPVADRHSLVADSHSPVADRHSPVPNPYSLFPIPSSNIKLRFKTPLRLVTNGELVHRLSFATLMRRLFERLSTLWGAYADESLSLDFPTLLTQAELVRVAEDNTRWVELERYSNRQQRRMPMGGLVGDIAFEGDLAPFLPWLIWGSITHLGKYAVMGNGWYELRSEQGVGNRE